MNNLKTNTNVVIGYNTENNKPVELSLDDRMYNTLIVGPTDCNKNEFTVKTLMKQDIKNNSGVILMSPNGKLSRELVSLCEHYNREVVYFNPCDKVSKMFNPLSGDTKNVSRVLVDTFVNCINERVSDEEQINLHITFKNGLTLLKNTYGEANLKDFYFLLSNKGGSGEEIVYEFIKKSTENQWSNKSRDEFLEELELANYFLNYYENKSVRSLEFKVDSIIEDALANKYLSRVLVLNRCEENELDFDYALSNNIVLSISTAHEYTRHLGDFIGELLVNTLFTSIFNSSCKKRSVFKTIYLDESQLYLNDNYLKLLKSGRAYNISSVLTLQSTEALLDSNKTKYLYIDTIGNARNVLLYPGLSYIEAEKYASHFNHFLAEKGIPNRFTSEDLVSTKFGQITAMTISNKQFTAPQVIDVKYI